MVQLVVVFGLLFLVNCLWLWRFDVDGVADESVQAKIFFNPFIYKYSVSILRHLQDNSFAFLRACIKITEGTMSDGIPFTFQAQGHHNRLPVYTASREASGDKFISAPSVMFVMQYMVTSVLALVTLKYQAEPESLFRDNPAPVWCFLAATCIYCLIIVTKEITTIEGKCSQTLSSAALASGVLSAISLLSMLLPHPVSFVPLVLWIPLPVVLAWPMFRYVYSLLNTRITSIINKIEPIKVWATGSNSAGKPSLPV